MNSSSHRQKFVLLFLAIFMGCTPVHPGDEVFASMVSSEDFNESVVLAPISVETREGSGVFLSLELTNKARVGARFPPGYGVRGFVWMAEEGEWGEFPNEIVVPQAEYELGPANGEVPFVGTANYASADERLMLAESMRIMVEGWLLNRDGTRGEPVFAFIDIVLAER